MSGLAPNTRAAAILASIEAEVPHLGLAAGPPPRTAWAVELERIDDRTLLGAEPRDRSMALALRSGLLLRADLLDESHALSQRIETPTGSFWHGILHRREGDFDNAKYWFRRVGRHEVFSRLEALPGGGLAAIRGTDEPVGKSAWDPFFFVDLVASRHRGPRDELTLSLERLQLAEFAALFEHCFRAALGSHPPAGG